MRVFKNIITALSLGIFLTVNTSAVLADYTKKQIAPPSGVVSPYTAHASTINNWVTMSNSQGFGQNIVYWPKDNFSLIGSMQFVPDPENASKAVLRSKMLGSEKWVRYAREDVGQAGIPSNLISERINQFPKTASFVFANYSPENAELVIEVQKIEKTPTNVLNVYRADFTPWHGEYNKLKRDYLTFSEQTNPAQMGYNPFEKFKGSTTDNVFHNISWEAAGVAVGEAMKRYDAHIGWIASDNKRYDQRTKKSGGLFTRSVTTYIDGYAKPQWFVAMPLGHQPNGGVSAICVTSTGAKNATGSTKTCDAPEHVAMSGVSIQAWDGGNMPVDEEWVYKYENKKTSLTMISFAIITFAVTWGVGSMLSSTIGASSVTSLSSLQIGAIGGGLYAGANMLQGTGLTDAQSSWAGTTGDGVLVPDSGSWNEHQAGANLGIHNKQIVSKVGTGLIGDKKLYSGDCDPSLKISECQALGQDAGTMLRP